MTFAYDYQGRRIRKQVETYGNGQWSVTDVRAFVYQGWRIVLGLDGRDLNSDGLPDNTVLRKYTWGLDLAGQNGSINSLGGAGGIGGLLAVEEPQTVGDPHRYVYFYDANGNVGQVVDLSASDAPSSIKAKYEYGPYGDRTNTIATGEYDQPFRFSSKYFDAEMGLGYWGYRYYWPNMGRWGSRDPVNEVGGWLLYGFVGNQPIDKIDAHGLWRDGQRCADPNDPARRKLEERLRELSLQLGQAYLRGDKELVAELERELVKIRAELSKGHSDFPGGDIFDYTLEDHDPNTSPLNPNGTPRHFRPLYDVQPDVDNAIQRCDADAFQRFMHQGQDSFTHWNGGYEAPLGHGPVSLLCIDDPDDSNTYSARYGAAARWSQQQLDKWNKVCCRNKDGQWEKCKCNSGSSAP